MTVELYMDFLSQPSRAVLAFCIANNIPYTIKEVRLLKGDHLTPEFAQVSPNRLVPAIVHNSFALSESAAILAYLAREFSVPDHWYPSDLRQRALVDQYLHWHHTNTRLGLGVLLFAESYAALRGVKVPADSVADLERRRRSTLQYLEQQLSKCRYVVGDVGPSVADLLCYCECVHMAAIRFDFGKFPSIQRWMSLTEQVPGVQQAHAVFYKVLPKLQPKL